MKTAFLFPGYGVQHVGMGQNLFLSYPLVQDYFKDASEYLDIDFQALCFSGTENEINAVDNAYLAIYVVSCAISGVLHKYDVNPTVVAGYDTGQYAALYASGAISFQEGLDILQAYGNLYNNLLAKNRYDIIKVDGLTSTKLSNYLDNQAHIAAYLSRTQHIVTGTEQGVQNVRDTLRRAGQVTLYPQVLGLGLNSELMDPMVDSFAAYMNDITLQDAQVPLISNITGHYLTDSEVIRKEIIKLVHSPIYWDRVIDALEDIDRILGIGSKEYILDLPKDKYPRKQCQAVRTKQEVDEMLGFAT